MFSIPEFLKRGEALLQSAGPLFIVVGLVVWVVASAYTGEPKPDQMNEVMEDIGFHPVMASRGLGSIYSVSSDGDFQLLCTAEDQQLRAVTRASSTTEQVASELQKARSRLSAELLRNIEANGNAGLSEAVKLELDEVEVLEVSFEGLAVIANELLKEASCERKVRRPLGKGDHVCQAQQFLKATTRYSVAFDDIDRLKRIAELIKSTYDPQAISEGGQISGRRFHYGIKLAPRCLTLPGQRARREPLTVLQRMIDRLGVPDLFN